MCKGCASSYPGWCKGYLSLKSESCSETSLNPTCPLKSLAANRIAIWRRVLKSYPKYQSFFFLQHSKAKWSRKNVMLVREFRVFKSDREREREMPEKKANKKLNQNLQSKNPTESIVLSESAGPTNCNLVVGFCGVYWSGTLSKRKGERITTWVRHASFVFFELWSSGGILSDWA